MYIYIYIHVYMYVCVCMFVCIYVCMYVCMYVCKGMLFAEPEHNTFSLLLWHRYASLYHRLNFIGPMNLLPSICDYFIQRFMGII